MQSIHDVGGKQGLGTIVSEMDEPAFHAPWEGRMHGIAVACQIAGVNTTPEQRATIENMPHWLYLVTSYYEKWLYCYEKILEAKGVISSAEIDRRMVEQPGGRFLPILRCLLLRPLPRRPCDGSYMAERRTTGRLLARRAIGLETR
jgi:hypothetical protein